MTQNDTFAHGARRDRHYETRWAKHSAVTETVSERWCAFHQAWIEVRGVVGGLAFDIEHGHRTDDIEYLEDVGF